MRILHAISTIAPSSGGPTNLLRELALAQFRYGHEVTVATTNRGNPVREVLPDSYLESFFPAEVTLRAFPTAYSPLLFSPRMGAWLRRSITEFDIVHVHGMYRFPPTYAAYQARSQAVPYIIRPHGSLDVYMYDKSSAGNVWLKRLYERLFDLPNLHAASAIHYTTEEERERASFLKLRAPSFVVPNGLDWERYRTLPPCGALRTRWAIGKDPLVLFLGRLHFTKGLDLLIPAFDVVRRRIPDVHLLIVGPENDSYGLKVRQWVRERGLSEAVHFVGPLYGNDVVQAYVDADVFVLPSYAESFGITVAEAMACAVPVVITDQVSIHAEVSRAGAGIVTRCDVAEVANALEILLRDKARQHSMGRAGQRLVRNRYTWSAIVAALTKEYETVIKRNRRAMHQRG